MKVSRRSFLKSVAAVAAVTAAGIALPTASAVEAMIEPEVAKKIYPAAVAPKDLYLADLQRAILYAKKEHEEAILRGVRWYQVWEDGAFHLRALLMEPGEAPYDAAVRQRGRTQGFTASVADGPMWSAYWRDNVVEPKIEQMARWANLTESAS